MTQGTLVNEGSGWLRFELDDMELIVAKKNVRSQISWNHLDSVGCVFGTKVITIAGNDYKVRLLTGANTNPTITPDASYYHPSTHNSEWSRLFYPIITDDPYVPVDKKGTHGNYKQVDLGLADGKYSLTQDSYTGAYYEGYGILRGGMAASYSGLTDKNSTASFISWRPCLERI